MNHSKSFYKLFVFSILIFFQNASCKKAEKNKSEKLPLETKVDASLKTPVDYCEKTFYCSFKKLISDDARKVLNYKRKEFLKNCNLALSKLPDKMTKEFNSCISKKCGTEFRKCIMKISDKYIVPPEQTKKEKAKAIANKSKVENNDKASKISPKPKKKQNQDQKSSKQIKIDKSKNIPKKEIPQKN